MKANKKNNPLTQMTTKRVAIYCRVSTIDQGKGDYSSLDSQAEIVKQYCLAKGWTIYKVYTDTKTGTTLEREQLSQLIHDARDKKFDIVAITKLDRISRSVKDFLELDETFNTLNVDIVVTTQNIDTTTPSGKMQRTIMLAFAEFERDMIAERTREKLYSQAQKGYWGGGNVLLGYQVINKRLEIIEEEADLVRRIFRYYQELPSTYKVAQKLNGEGFKTKVRKTKTGKVLGGAPFTNQNVYDILKNKQYIGLITYKDQQFKGLHTAIIPEAEFEEVQKMLTESRVDRYITHDVSELILLGLVKCGFCEKGMTTTFGKRDEEKYYYYKCTVKTKLGTGQCNEKDIPADQVERMVELLISRLGDNEEFFNAVFKQAAANEDTTLIDLKEELKKLTDNRGLTVREVKRIGSFIAKAPDGFDATPYYAQSTELQVTLKQVDEKIESVKKRIAIIEQITVSKTKLREHYKQVGRVYGEIDKPAKRQIARALLTEITFKYKKTDPKGEIRLGFRGDGTAVEEWYKKQNLETLVSRFYVQ